MTPKIEKKGFFGRDLIERYKVTFGGVPKVSQPLPRILVTGFLGQFLTQKGGGYLLGEENEGFLGTSLKKVKKILIKTRRKFFFSLRSQNFLRETHF